MPSDDDQLQQLKRAWQAIKELRARLESVEHARTEPIAIIGLGCRFPGGANSPEAFWRLLVNGVDAITEVPSERWDSAALFNADPDAVGKVTTRWGGFLQDVDQFDAAFFGIAPREAARMDPQQRLLLEVAWEALEDAGQTIEQLAGSQTGVFVGVHSHSQDYYGLQAANPDQIDSYTGTGTAHNVVSGRLAYFFDLHGPNVAVDTACSSSLVAVHLAVQSLRNNDCALAVAGGVNVMLSPHFTIAASRMRMLASDGRCKAFDARADGFVRGEGCGVVVLKRLSRALADGDPIHAVIRGSAINQDGHTNGLTAPNGLAQQAVIRAALENAGVEPARLTYIETHGTGTPLGDPIEVEALAVVLDHSAPQRCYLGSVKTNIGHLEGAAGIAGLIKTVLALKQHSLPPNLHFEALNPHIQLGGTRFAIPTSNVPWSAAEPRCAGVSSFGWSGTNAHMIVEEAPTPTALEQQRPALSHYLLPISARDPAAIRSAAQAYRDYLDADRSTVLADVGYTAGARRSQHDYRLAVVGRTCEELIQQLDLALKSEVPGGHKPVSRLPGIAFVCPGQGSQWPGMGRQLYAHVPVFRKAIDQCDQALRPLVEWSLVEQLTSPGARLSEIDVIQPTLCAIEIALAAVWCSWGFEPDAVVGHSMGEVAAAYIAGALTLDEAMLIICTRSRMMKRLSGQGAMAVVNLSVAEAQAAIRGREDQLAVAVSNSPQSSVLSGDPIALEAVLETLRAKNVFCRQVQVDVAAHSPHMDALRGELEVNVRDLQPRASTHPMYSTVTGHMIDGEQLTAAYWGRNLREPVLFSAATQQLINDDVTTFIELSPHPILLAAIEQGLQQRGQTGLTVPSLRREDDEQAVLLHSVGALYAQGYAVAWDALYSHGRVVALPAYPWQHERFWFQASVNRSTTQHNRGVRQDHPLLGWRLDLADRAGGFVWEVELSRQALPHLYDHRLNGMPVLAASTYVELALAAGRAAYGDQLFTLADVSFKRALPLTDERLLVQVALAPGVNDRLALSVHSRHVDEWVLHFSAALQTAAPEAALHIDSLDTIQARAQQVYDAPAVYQQLAANEVQIGETLRAISRLWRGHGNALAHLKISAINDAYCVAPAALDSLFQLLGFVLEDQGILMPVQAEALCVFAWPAALQDCWGYVRPREIKAGQPVVDLYLLDDTGRVIIEVAGLRLTAFGHERGASANVADWLYDLQWVTKANNTGQFDALQNGSDPWLIFADQHGVGDALASLLDRRGQRSVLISAGSAYERLSDTRLRLRFDQAADVQRVFEHIAAIRGVVYLADAAVNLLNPAAACEPVMHILHELPRHNWPTPPRLWLVTRSAQLAQTTTPLAQAALWGLGRVVAEEQREFWGGLIDLDAASQPEESAALLLDEFWRSDGEDQVAYRHGLRHVPRLQRCPSQPAGHEPFKLRLDATYLITGGLGGIGVEVARWLAQRGARRLILLGRTPLPPRVEWDQCQDARLQRMIHAVRGIEALGVSVQYGAIDVADEPQLRSFVEDYRLEGWPPIKGIIHAAGVIDDRMLTQLDAESLRAVMQPKAAGAWLLHRLFEDQPLDFFILFSSVGSLFGQVGQGSYAAANAVLDALAHYRRAHSLPALSINWGAWSGLGFAATAGGRRVIDHLEAQGMPGFPAQMGLDALALAMHNSLPQVVVQPIVWSQLRQSSAGTNPLLQDLIAEDSDQSEQRSPEKSLRATLLELAPAQRRAALEVYLQNTLAQVLRLAPNRIEPDMPFGRLGLESLMAVEFRNRLATTLDLNLSATLAWNYPTITELAAFLAEKLEPTGSHAPIASAPLTAEVDPTVMAIEAMTDDEALQTLRRRKGAR